MVAPHLNIDMFVWVGEGAVAGGLFDQLAAMGKDERLRGITDGGKSVNQVRENDLGKLDMTVLPYGMATCGLARAGGQ